MRPKISLKTASNSPSTYSGGITIKSNEELIAVRRAGKVVASVHQALKQAVRPGLTTKDLDIIAEREIRKHGATPTFKGYFGFPASICASINDEIVHGIPGKRVLRSGDLIKLDVGATLDGYIGDAAVTLPVGDISNDAMDLIEATRISLQEGINAAMPGNRTGDIGAAVEAYANSKGYAVVREYVGHGVGRFLHEDPQIPNYGHPGMGNLLRPGMVIAIEPMLNIGGAKTRVLDDHWTVVTADSSLSSHFEHTVIITESGPEITTGVK
jgi:methionyl aminopeptidase